MGCCRALQIINVFCGLYSIGARANITVIEGVWTQGAFECNSTVTIRCHVNPNSYTVQWFVGNLVGSLADADCFGYGCTNSVKFRGRYTYTYNDSAGYSDLNIRHVSFDDDQMIYQCSDGSATNIFRLNATTIKAPPKTNTTMLNITTVSINNITAKLTTGCIYPAEEITLIWYSSLEDGSAFRNYHVNHKQVTCLPTMTCERANTSLESVLLINTTRSGHERIFYVNISYGSVLISKYVGKYNVSEEIFQSKNQVSDGNTLGRIIGGSVGGGVGFLVILVICCCSCKQIVRRKCCKCGSGGNLQKNDTDYPYGPCCKKSFEYCPPFRVRDETVETIGFHTAPRETSITCTWHKEFKNDEVVHLSYTNTETVKKCDKTLTADEKQKRSCTIRNLQPWTIYSLVMKASDSRSRTIKKTDPIKVQTLVLKPPKTLKFLNIDDDKIKVSWEPAFSDTNQCFCLIFYPTSAQNPHKKGNNQIMKYVNYETPYMEKTFTRLQKNTIYQFEIFTFIGTKRSISLVDFVQTTGTEDATETQHTGPKLNTTVRNLNLTDTYSLEYIKS